MSSTELTIDMTDMRFILFDQLKIDEEFAGVEKYEDWDADTCWSILEEAEKMAVEVLHPINGPGDREGCKLDADGNVTTPKGYKEAWALVSEGGWTGLTALPEWGGMGAPPIISILVSEMMTAGACGFWMYSGLAAAAGRVVAKFGPEGKNVEYASKMFAGEWGGTMCLTESGAGTSVGDNRCKATPIEGEDGAYLLEGEKIFISGGDNDFTENIIHLVLAKTPGAPEGTRGISLFLVSKYHLDDEMNIGERNGAKVVGIEHKMGINGSATCVLALGTDMPCKGHLIGEEGGGMPLMFHMMNEARIGVGGQGVAVAAAAYRYALAYCNERVQGTSIENFKNADAPRVAIVNHPDVRRMLMWQKCQVEAMRSLICRMAARLDLAEAGVGKNEMKGQVELLVPILKAHCSDVGFEVSVSALQCFGGYGYIGEYPVEQLVRDAKIFSIYEGTNGVQAMDLLGRKMRMKGGALFMEWMQDAMGRIAEGKAAGFDKQAAALEKAVSNAGAAAMHLGQLGAKGDLKGTMLQATPFQRMMGVIVLGIESLNQARIAKALIAEKGETNHLIGKLRNVEFYCANILPEAVAIAKSVQVADDSCMDPRLFQPE